VKSFFFLLFSYLFSVIFPNTLFPFPFSGATRTRINKQDVPAHLSFFFPFLPPFPGRLAEKVKQGLSPLFPFFFLITYSGSETSVDELSLPFLFSPHPTSGRVRELSSHTSQEEELSSSPLLFPSATLETISNDGKLRRSPPSFFFFFFPVSMMKALFLNTGVRLSISLFPPPPPFFLFFP